MKYLASSNNLFQIIPSWAMYHCMNIHVQLAVHIALAMDLKAAYIDNEKCCLCNVINMHFYL